MTARRVITFHVVEPEAGQRLDRVAAARGGDLSRARVQALMRQGCVLVDGAPARPAQRAKVGQRLEIEIPPPTPAEMLPEPIPLAILHEDEDIIVINKAAGMVVHPAPGHGSGTIVNALLGRYGDSFSVGGEVRPGLVHRLDKGTSGVLLVARHDAALEHLQRQFKLREVLKVYLALVHGQPPATARLDTPYGRHPRHRQRYTSRGAQHRRRAALRYRVLRRFEEAALVEVELETGRTHQIRVQLADAGFPVVGDETYGRGRCSPRHHRPALHAFRLACAHPRSGERVSFEAPLAADLEALVATLAEEA